MTTLIVMIFVYIVAVVSAYNFGKLYNHKRIFNAMIVALDEIRDKYNRSGDFLAGYILALDRVKRELDKDHK